MSRNDIINQNGSINWDTLGLITDHEDYIEVLKTNIVEGYDIFPSANIIKTMSNNTVFTTKGFYTKGDGFGCTYIATTNPWAGSALSVGTKYVVPVSQPVGEIFLPYYGLRTGASYSTSNSAIMSSIVNMQFASLIRFPSGHFYFDTTLSIGGGQFKITGAAPVGYSLDANILGLTWLHFPNLTNGQTGLSCSASSISNIIFYGNPSTYNCNIDRTKTVIAPDQIVTETNTATTYGINATSTCDIQNCGFRYFYYGIYSATANTTISNIFANNCHFAVSVGGDTKVSRIFGFNVMIALQIRASISSAETIRGDSIGQHLVHVIGGSNIYLSDLDADYCLKSILHLGDGSWSTVGSLLVNGIHGRCCTYRAYDTTATSEPAVDSITTSANVEEYPVISVNKQTNVNSAKIVMLGSGGANPIDTGGNYLTPTILLAADASTSVQNIEISIIGSLASGDTNPLTPTWLSKRIKTLSGNDRNLEVSVRSAFDNIRYKQAGSWFAYSKVTTQGVLLVDSTVAVTNNCTITSSGTPVARLAVTGAATGCILSAGSYSGQETCLINEATTAGYTVTFAASATSHVAGGTAVFVDVNSAMKFMWDAGTSLWYKI